MRSSKGEPVKTGEIRIERNRVTAQFNVGTGGSGSGASLNSIEDDNVSVTLMKSSPADPHLTSVQSVSGTTVFTDETGALRSVAQLIDSVDKELDGRVRLQAEGDGSPSSSFFDSFMNTMSFKHISHGVSKEVSGSLTQSHSGSAKRSVSISQALAEGMSRTVPQKEAAITSVERNLLEANPKSGLCHASKERNEEFHKLFKSIDIDDHLIDNFDCTLTHDLLLQGTLYITEKNICYSSKMLKWGSLLSIPFTDITYMEKSSPDSSYSNSIVIETANGKTFFNRFEYTDKVFDLLRILWSNAITNTNREDQLKQIRRTLSPVIFAEHRFNNDFMQTYKPLGEIYSSSDLPQPPISDGNDYIIDNAIRSVDDSISIDDSNKTTSLDKEAKRDLSSMKIKGHGLKLGTEFVYEGPLYCQKPTNFPESVLNDEEYVLSETTLDAPPGLVFQLMFSESNTDFWERFLSTQSSSNLSPFTLYDNLDENGRKYREYKYTKALNYPVGPQSTICYTRDTIQHFDDFGYFDVLTSTKTPDVPSGNSFCTNTRYMFRWESKATCSLRISYWVEWTGSSWIKGMINSSCKSGQIDVNKTMVPFIESFLKENTEETDITIDTGNRIEPTRSNLSQKSAAKKSYGRETIETPKRDLEPQSVELPISSILLILAILLLSMNLYFQYKLQKLMTVLQIKLNEAPAIPNQFKDIKDLFNLIR